MSCTQLLIRLRKLNDELTSINDYTLSPEQVDEATIEALGQLVTDASDLVDRSVFGNLSSRDRDELLEKIDHFECKDHRVSEFLSQLVELLALIEV
jgi:hypothetical protein